MNDFNYTQTGLFGKKPKPSLRRHYILAGSTLVVLPNLITMYPSNPTPNYAEIPLSIDTGSSAQVQPAVASAGATSTRKSIDSNNKPTIITNKKTEAELAKIAAKAKATELNLLLA